MDTDIFKEVNGDDKLKVLETVKKDIAKQFLLHEYIFMMIESTNNPHISQQLFCCGNMEDGVFLVETKLQIQPDELTFYFIYTVSADLTQMCKALTETNRIPWLSKRYIFEVTLSRFTPVVRQVFIAKKIQAVVQHYSLYWMPKETVLEVIKPQPSVSLEFLNEKHAPDVAKQWPSFPGSVHFLEKEILAQFGLGVFRTDKKLLSFILRFHSGGIYMLFSDPEFRRRGYGEFVLRHMVKEVRQRGSIPFCTVLSDNIPSLNLLKKIGFQDFDKADYIFPSQFFQEY